MVTRLPLKAQAVLLALLLTSSTACTRVVEVPTYIPRPVCDPGPFPPFPDPESSPCGDQVCLPPQAVAAIWEWAREVERWAERAALCLGSHQ